MRISRWAIGLGAAVALTTGQSFAADGYYNQGAYRPAPDPPAQYYPASAAMEPEAAAQPASACNTCCQPAPSCGCEAATSCCQTSCCNGCDDCYLWGPSEPWELFGTHDCTRIKVAGWSQWGYHSDNVPLSFAYGDLGAFNDVPGRLHAQQQWLFIQRELDTECGWDWGFRADVLYGTDAQKTQAFGGSANNWDNSWDHGVYGWALPQAFAEVGVGDLTVRLGKFFTTIGFETVPAPDNFFYSHALTMFNSEPFTHTGALGQYKASDDLTLYGGWTLGWDTGFESFDGGNNFLGGFAVKLTDDVTFTYMTTIGDFGRRGNGGYMHSVLFNVVLTEKLTYILQSDFLNVNRRAEDVDVDNGIGPRDEDIGVNQYLIYQYNDCIGIGGRAEWWRNDGVSHYSVTGGVNIKPMANLIFRPEVRHSWSPADNYDVTIFGVDGIFTF